MTRTESHWYSVGEMASLFGLTRQTLIYYDKIGLFCPAAVNEDGYRLYLPTQIPTLRMICLLKDLGLELKEIGEITDSRNMTALMDYLVQRRDDLGRRVSKLESQRDLIDRRLDFYRTVDHWRDTTDTPILRQFDERLVVTEPFPKFPITRDVLHPTLMKSMRKLRAVEDGVPVDGFGSILVESEKPSADGIHSYRMSGACTVVPASVDASKLSDVVMLPKGLYACMSYWGMPYQDYACKRLMKWLAEHNFEPYGYAFDFCLLDTATYNDAHQQDLSCIQVMVKF